MAANDTTVQGKAYKSPDAFNIKSGGTLEADAASLSTAELTYLDITTLGTGAASKAVVLDAGEDFTWPATGVLTYGVLKDPAATTISATGAEINTLASVTAGAASASKAVVLGAASEISGIRRKVNLAAATQAVTAAMSGERFVGAVDAVFTLPAAAAGTKGVWYEFETGSLSGGTGLSVSPAAADHIRGNGLTSVDDKDLINDGATDRLGDSVRLYCDGVDGWVIESIVGTWSKEA